MGFRATSTRRRSPDMMRDPRYWRERDATFVAQVTEGFQRLYPQLN